MNKWNRGLPFAGGTELTMVQLLEDFVEKVLVNGGGS
jgi:hypothetical protein